MNALIFITFVLLSAAFGSCYGYGYDYGSDTTEELSRDLSDALPTYPRSKEISQRSADLSDDLSTHDGSIHDASIADYNYYYTFEGTVDFYDDDAYLEYLLLAGDEYSIYDDENQQLINGANDVIIDDYIELDDHAYYNDYGDNDFAYDGTIDFIALDDLSYITSFDGDRLFVGENIITDPDELNQIADELQNHTLTTDTAPSPEPTYGLFDSSPTLTPTTTPDISSPSMEPSEGTSELIPSFAPTFYPSEFIPTPFPTTNQIETWYSDDKIYKPSTEPTQLIKTSSPSQLTIRRATHNLFLVFFYMGATIFIIGVLLIGFSIRKGFLRIPTSLLRAARNNKLVTVVIYFLKYLSS